MSTFDIATLLHFDPPEFLCANCTRIFHRSEVEHFEFETDWLKCPICGKHYSNRNEFIKVDIDNIVEHSRNLANIANAMKQSIQDKKIPPLRILLIALGSARTFIHITTFNMSHILLGALKLVSQNVDVRGLVANANNNLQKEINNYTDENPRMNLIALPESKTYRHAEGYVPHQKLIVIDGLLAFTGPTNFTSTAWRSAKKDLDLIEIKTEISKIQSLHDKFFSQHWYKLNPKSQDFSEEIPF